MERHVEITGSIIGAAMEVHTAAGPGLLESAYEAALQYELALRGHDVQRQVLLPMRYKRLIVDQAFRADLIVDGKVLVELKIAEGPDNQAAQVITYLRVSDLRVGLLLNFGVCSLRDGIRRFVNDAPRGRLGGAPR